MDRAGVGRAARLSAELRRRNNETLLQYEPLEKIKAWHRSKARVRSLLGGNRSGKTTAGAIEVGWFATGTHPYREVPQEAKILGVENEWSLIGDPMWAKLGKAGGVKIKGRRTPPIIPKRLIKQISWLDKAHEIPDLVILKNGATINFKPCESGREKFEGAEYDLVWCDEELDDVLVFQEILRSLIDRGGALISTATPLARGRPLLDLHEMAGDPNAPLDVFETFISIFDNRHIDAKMREAFINTIPEEMRSTRIFGQFLILEGLVYGEWDPEQHEVPASYRNTIPNDWPRIIVIDPGYADPCAVLWVVQIPGDPPRYVAYREYYQRRRTVSQVVQDIAQMTGDEPIVKVIIDPSSIKKAQNATETVYRQFNRFLRNCGLKNARTGRPLSLRLGENAIRPGIYNFKEFLRISEHGEAGFRITDDLRYFKRELHRYCWPNEREKRANVEVPIDRDNHLLDDARYLLMDTPLKGAEQDLGKSSSERIWEKAQSERIAEQGEFITVGGGR